MIETDEIERDATDDAIIAARMADYDRRDGPRVGDFIRFADGQTRRASHVWPADWHDDNIARVQTSDGGSFYLGGLGPRSATVDLMSGDEPGRAFVSFSGALYNGVRADALIPTTELRDGSVWVFHHDWPGAGRGVDAVVPFRVYDCSLAAPR